MSFPITQGEQRGAIVGYSWGHGGVALLVVAKVIIHMEAGERCFPSGGDVKQILMHLQPTCSLHALQHVHMHAPRCHATRSALGTWCAARCLTAAH